MSGTTEAAARLLAGGPGPLHVVRGPTVTTEDAARVLGDLHLSGRPATDRVLDGPAPEGPAPGVTAPGAGDEAADPAGALLLVLRDRLELRRAVAACRGLPSSTRLGCVLLDGGSPPLTAGRPHWPAVEHLAAAASPVCLVVVLLSEPLGLGELAADLARRSTPRHLMGADGPVVGAERGAPRLWPPGDGRAVVAVREQLTDVQGDFPPDVLLTEDPAALEAPAAARAADRHAVVAVLHEDLRLPPPSTWADYHRLGSGPGDRQLAAVPPVLALGAVDSQLLNPRGFLRRADGPVRALEEVPGSPHLCRVDTAAGPLLLDTRRGLGERDVARLRALRGVHLGWRGADGPGDHCRLVVSLAAAGVPLTCDRVPSWARALLHPSLVEALEHATELQDRVLREVHSIRLRRAALAHHDETAWRRAVAVATGAAPPRPPRVSVLLATRRPELLGFALRQVARQRDVELELVVAAHGHDVDHRRLDALAAASSVAVTSLTGPADQPFGTLLDRAADRAGGDLLLKMDDDDWYGPHFAADLLLARRYSGADVTGTAPEFVYVESLDLTVRRRDATEVFRPVVAGGTMLLSRDCLREVGGFRPLRRYVDAGLLQAVTAAGGSVYRTHGHGYLLRRRPGGHTWDPGPGYFVSRSRTAQQWRGFRPSPLLAVDEVDHPGAVPPAPEPEV